MSRPQPVLAVDLKGPELITSILCPNPCHTTRGGKETPSEELMEKVRS